MNKRKLEVTLVLTALVMGIIIVAMEPSLKKGKNIPENETIDLLETTTDNEDIQTPEESTTAQERSEVSLVAVGDNLIHDNVIKCGLQDDGSYNYDELFEVLKDEFQSADLAVINQETILGGDEYDYAGYPNFNTPDEMGDAIIDAGFDIVLQASNHALDVGTGGIRHCISYWKSRSDEITMLGLNESYDEQNTIKTIERNGITFAVLNYTYGLNGYYLPEDESYLVNIIDDNKVISDIEKAEEIADFTIVFPHWGTEYSFTSDISQTSLAMEMTQAGADLIIGTHPHVLEPIEWIESENGNKALCYYSLGNYTSGQDATPRILGGMAKVTIVKDNDNIYIDDAGIVPVITHYIWGENRINQTYKLSEYTEELALQHSLRYYDSTFSIDYLKELAEDIVGDWIVD
ncbi:MAG: CapA family protein [Eubacterium sp.]